MKKNFEFLDHTADAKFRAYGSSLAESFKSAAFAMFSLLIDSDQVKSEIKLNMTIESKKKTSLLYDFLEELLFNLDVSGFLLAEIPTISITKENDFYVLNAVIVGDHSKNYPSIYGNIKSITYNEMIIDESFSSISDRKIMLQVVVDL